MLDEVKFNKRNMNRERKRQRRERKKERKKKRSNKVELNNIKQKFNIIITKSRRKNYI